MRTRSTHRWIGVACAFPSATCEFTRCRDHQVEDVTVGDDCSIPENETGVAGKRGLVGMLFVIKIAGALAERGSPLREVTEIARCVSQNTATYGVGLSACAIPGTRQSRFSIEIRREPTVTRRNHARAPLCTGKHNRHCPYVRLMKSLFIERSFSVALSRDSIVA